MLSPAGRRMPCWRARSAGRRLINAGPMRARRFDIGRQPGNFLRSPGGGCGQRAAVDLNARQVALGFGDRPGPLED